MRLAIVLAGGRSTRFGADKLAADLDGRSVLGAAIDAVIGVVDRVAVVGLALPAGFTGGAVQVSIVRDRSAFAGPLAALHDVLDPVGPDADDLAIVVGGDMPLLVPAVLERMLDRLAADPMCEAVTLGRPRPEGTMGSAPPGTTTKRQVLPLALRVRPARGAVAAAIGAGDRSLRAMLDRLSMVELPPSEWRALDPAGDTVADVDTVEDLERIRAARSH